MLILFFKAIDARRSSDGFRRGTERKTGRTGGDDEALEKIRAIFQQRVDEAETDEDRERAEQELAKFKDASSKPQ